VIFVAWNTRADVVVFSGFHSGGRPWRGKKYLNYGYVLLAGRGGSDRETRSEV